MELFEENLIPEHNWINIFFSGSTAGMTYNDIIQGGDTYLSSSRSRQVGSVVEGSFYSIIKNGVRIAAGSNILLEEGGDIQFTSIPPPIACKASLIETDTGNLNNVKYTYKVSYVNSLNEETELGETSNEVTVDNTHKQIQLSDIPISDSRSVIKRKIYRTKSGDSINYYFLTAIEDNKTTTYTDNTADADLVVNETYKINNTFGKLYSNNELCGNFAGNNTFLGFWAGKNNTIGYHNTFLGPSAGRNNTTGHNNVFIGTGSGISNTTGYYNVAIGASALSSLTTGYDNVVIGAEAGTLQTTDYENIAIGRAALGYSNIGSRNVAIGTRALFLNTSSLYNIAIGHYAGYNLTHNGNSNVMIGDYAGYSIHTNSVDSGGYQNVFIGRNSGYHSSQRKDATNTIAIGYNSYTDANNKACIGNSSMTWIGGQVSWSTYSDERQKAGIKDYTHGLDFILKLQPKEFYIKDDKTKVKHIGFIAQEVEKTGIPFHGLTPPKSENGFYSLSYPEFVVPLVNAVKELYVEVQQLKDKLNNKI